MSDSAVTMRRILAAGGVLAAGPRQRGEDATQHGDRLLSRRVASAGRPWERTRALPPRQGGDRERACALCHEPPRGPAGEGRHARYRSRHGEGALIERRRGGNGAKTGMRVCVSGVFRSVEMPSQVSLAVLELNGMGFSVQESERQKHVMQAKLAALESQAYDLAGHSFSLTSVDDVAQVRTRLSIPARSSRMKRSNVGFSDSPVPLQVLFFDLHLPPNGDVGGPKSKKTLGYTRRGVGGRVRLGKQFSTTKVKYTSSMKWLLGIHRTSVESLFNHALGYGSTDDMERTLKQKRDVWQDVLEKLRPLHPLPGVILEWRRITNALTKVVFPLQREKRYHTALAMDRIHPIAQTHTATGLTHTHTHAG